MSEELKPVRCGCGGEAVIYVTHWWGKCYVCECDECGTASRPCTTKAEAITAWNRAIGAKDINVPDKERNKGKWLRRKGEDCWECSECHAVLENSDVGNHNFYYCYHCGTDMMNESGYMDIEEVHYG